MATERVLVVNAGSSSIKLRLLDGQDELVAEQDAEITSDPAHVLERFLERVEGVDAVGHRIVHGGPKLTRPTVIDAGVEAELAAAAELAPLHDPPALSAVAAAKRLVPDAAHVACFDTAFHATLPSEAAAYALPREWVRRWPLRRYGFHGLSHAYACRRAAQMLAVTPGELRTVSAHLGAGASLTAIDAGASVDTTMGFSTLDGLVMATRCGSVDPGLLMWVQRAAGMSPTEMEQALTREAGLLGLSGRSADMREILDGARRADARCQLAFDVYCHRLAGGIATMATAMGGIDALVFTGGVGENQPAVRAQACRRAALLGLMLEDAANELARGDAVISPVGVEPKVLVVTAREDLEIAAGVRQALAGV